ncbi:hypothetical protein M9Y10_045817 [Tritrichomonas musculus]|uniref:Ankyrin repeat protein n=1 Tax=Tritrichomonas musculus TaxID=1915356 RepID=A0ABR2JWC6_9EUKA
MMLFQNQFLNQIIFLNNITPLFSSILNDKYDTLKVLLTKYQDKIDINYSTSSGFTPIHLLCAQTDAHSNETIDLFLQSQINKIDKLDFKNCTCSPLHYAILSNNVKMVYKLINNPDLEVCCFDGFEHTILEDAINQKLFSICDQLFLLKNDKCKLSSYSYEVVELKEEKYLGNNFFSNRVISSSYSENLIQYFIVQKGDDIHSKLKNAFVDQNLSFFACLGARYLDEEEFEKFLDKHEVDINKIIPEAILKK